MSVGYAVKLLKDFEQKRYKMRGSKALIMFFLTAALSITGAACKSSPWRAVKAEGGGAGYGYYVKTGKWVANVSIPDGKHYIGAIYFAYKGSYYGLSEVKIYSGAAEIACDIPERIAGKMPEAGGGRYIAVYYQEPGFTVSPESTVYICEIKFESGKTASVRFSVAAFREAFEKL